MALLHFGPRVGDEDGRTRHADGRPKGFGQCWTRKRTRQTQIESRDDDMQHTLFFLVVFCGTKGGITAWPVAVRIRAASPFVAGDIR